MSASLNQPTSSAIKEGDTVLYTPTAEGEKEVRARVVKVHPDVGGAHYTILPHVKDAKEKNTTAERVSKVSLRGLAVVGRQRRGVSCWPDEGEEGRSGSG